jgi:polysaccharide transporter, PST family
VSPARSTWLKYGRFMGSVGAARVIGALLTAITFPIILRRLGVEMYGIWSYVIAVLSFLDLVANPGLSSHAGQQVAARRVEASEVVSDSLVLRAFLGVVVVGVIFLLAAFEVRPDAARLLRFYGICITLVNLTSSEYLLSSLELFHERSLLVVVQQALYTVGIVLMVRSPQDYMWVPGSILLSAIPTNLSGWIFLHKKGLRVQLGLHTRRWWPMLAPSGHYALATFMSTVYHRTGHLLVRWFLGEHALGIYAAATRLVDFVRNLVSMGFMVITPRVAQSADSPTSLRRLARFSVAGIALVGLPLVVGVLTMARVLVPLVLGSQYEESARLLPWLAGYIVVAPLAVLFSGTVLYALGRHREYLISTAVGAVVAVIANFVLVPLAGIRGASIAFVLGEAVVALTAYRLSPDAARDVWDSPLLKAALAATAVMTVTLLVALMLHIPPLLASGVSGLLYVLVCGWQTRASIVAEMQRTD